MSGKPRVRKPKFCEEEMLEGGGRKRARRLDKLTLLRLSRGLRQQDVALGIGITTSYYGMIEQGVRLPQLHVAYKLAHFFNTSIEDIFFASRTT